MSQTRRAPVMYPMHSLGTLHCTIHSQEHTTRLTVAKALDQAMMAPWKFSDYFFDVLSHDVSRVLQIENRTNRKGARNILPDLNQCICRATPTRHPSWRGFSPPRLGEFVAQCSHASASELPQSSPFWQLAPTGTVAALCNA